MLADVLFWPGSRDHLRRSQRGPGDSRLSLGVKPDRALARQDSPLSQSPVATARQPVPRCARQGGLNRADDPVITARVLPAYTSHLCPKEPPALGLLRP